MEADSQLRTREVERIHTRYQLEVVEAFGLCPWAKEARTSGRVQMVVTFTRSADAAAVQATLPLIDDAMRAEATEVGMLIFPQLALGRLAFAHFVAEVRAAEESRRPRGQQPFALADFHPAAQPDTRTPQTLVPFLRRAPDPMIQIVRTGVLAHVRGPHDHGTKYLDAAQLAELASGTLPAPTTAVSTRVAEHNYRTVQRVGEAQLHSVFLTITADRNQSYAALGMDVPDRA